MKHFVLAIVAFVSMSFWVKECETVYFSAPLPHDGRLLEQFPQDIAGVYCKKMPYEDGIETSVSILRIDFPEPWQMRVVLEDYVHLKKPDHYLMRRLQHEHGQEMRIRYTDSLITVCSSEPGVECIRIERIGEHWKVQEEYSQLLYDLRANTCLLTGKGAPYLSHCVVLQKGQRLYMNRLVDPETNGWMMECYDFSQPGNVKYSIPHPDVFLNMARSGEVSASAIRVDSTLVWEEREDSSGRDSSRVYFVLPTDAFLEETLNTTEEWWTGGFRRITGDPFLEDR